ncbi:MAG: hypothetical protein JST28_07135 [Acidobacteria bacterium]|nr:hypothetical protein [Acidobacteriota bacterium]
MHSLYARVFLAVVLFSLLLVQVAAAQCDSTSQSAETLHGLYSQQKWEEVVTAAERLQSRSADVEFEFGMALAHLQRWSESRIALLAGRKTCPQDKRFPTELAGVAFQQKHYSEAAHWIQIALRLDPMDEYANEFAGTVFLLLGNLDAAVQHWNRIQKPAIDQLQFDPSLSVQRLLLERAFVFSPQAIMRRDQLLETQARLDAMGIFPSYSIRLDAREGGKFAAQFHAIERNGFGNGWLQSVVSVASGLPYETIYPSYFNLNHSATNIDSLLRWDAQKRRVWISVSGPWHYQPKWRWKITADGRDENWELSSANNKNLPALGSFKLKRESARAALTTIQSGRFQWAIGADLSHRTYTNVTSGPALNPDLVSAGTGITQVAEAHALLLDLPDHRLRMEGFASSEFNRLWSSPARLFEKVQGRTTLSWRPRAEGDRYEFMQRVRGGGTAGSPPIDELWMVGVERDNDLWLRGHVGTRDGKKGSAPMADRFFLSNTDFYRSVWSNGLLDFKAGPLLDIARTSAPTPGLAPQQWLFDIGAQLKITVLGTGVVLTYGRDLRTGNNAFYGSVAQH